MNNFVAQVHSDLEQIDKALGLLSLSREQHIALVQAVARIRAAITPEPTTGMVVQAPSVSMPTPASAASVVMPQKRRRGRPPKAHANGASAEA